jgi:hypothetical protein
MKRIFPMLIAALLAWTGAFCTAQEPGALTLEVSIPHKDGALPKIHWAKKEDPSEPHFQVILRNVSNKPQSYWARAFPEIEFTDAAGRKWVRLPTPLTEITSGLRTGSESIGGMTTLQPGAVAVFDIYLMRAQFNPANPRARDAYPGGKVILWTRFAANINDQWLNDELTARPMTCMVD